MTRNKVPALTNEDAGVPNEVMTNQTEGVPCEGLTQENPCEGLTQENTCEGLTQQSVDKQMAIESTPTGNQVDDEAVQTEGLTQEIPLQNHAEVVQKVKKEKLAHIRKSERIVKKKLSRNIIGVNGEGNSASKPVTLE
ncbi:hypothetical protein L2E82_28917 [Cichorium intybus]|uniref:Uncharacterized protein n=2 Tax=Cichorium intybus TaxID=13427 RepID=A0ACB8ZRM3_CICIN|nr:hypothetical protein L2E82_42585 [Cichorium intybus]KAI3738772.1 hypothetical protein L2E82_28917 [Cichorium intybus]